MRRLFALIVLAALAVPLQATVSATVAAASVTVPAPACDGGTNRIVPCEEGSSPYGVTVTWYVYDRLSTPTNFTVTTTDGQARIGCVATLTVYFSYVYNGVTYVSNSAQGLCIKGSP